MSEYPLTEELRRMCRDNGIPFSCGLYRRGEVVETANNTTVGVGEHSLTFEERDGALDCVDGMSVHEAFAAGVCAWSEHRRTA
jgi:hypothetical protein